MGGVELHVFRIYFYLNKLKKSATEGLLMQLGCISWVHRSFQVIEDSESNHSDNHVGVDES